MRTSLILIVLITFFMAASPAQSAMVEKPATLKKAEIRPGHTLVVFSTWAKTRSQFSVSEVVVKRVSDDKLVARAPIDEPQLKSHFSKGWGYVNAFELEPGAYRLELYSNEPYYDYDPAAQQIAFSVKPGKILYIGEAAFRLDKKGRGTLDINDRSARDFAFFLEKNPGFTHKDFIEVMAVKPKKSTGK